MNCLIVVLFGWTSNSKTLGATPTFSSIYDDPLPDRLTHTVTMAGEGRRRLAIPSMSFHKAGELGTFQQIASSSGSWGKKHRSEDE